MGIPGLIFVCYFPMPNYETTQDQISRALQPPEVIPGANMELGHHRLRLGGKCAIAGGIVAALALGTTGCHMPSAQLASSSARTETLPPDDALTAQAMLTSLQRAMGNSRYPLQGNGLDSNSMIKVDGIFTQWAITHNVDPQPGGPPMPGDVVLTKTGGTDTISAVRTATDSWGDATITVTLTGGAKLGMGQISEDGRALLPVPQNEPTVAAGKGTPPSIAPSSTAESPKAATQAPESESSSADSVKRARADIVRTVNSVLHAHAGQSPYEVVGGKSVWPEFLAYINKSAPSGLGQDPFECAFTVSFLLQKSGHPLSGGDPWNPSALYRVYNIPGNSTPIKALTLQEWVVKYGSYWSYGETGIKPQPGDILFLNGERNGSTMDHTGLVTGMDGDILTYAAGDDGSGRVFEKDVVNINNLQRNHILMAIGSIFPPSEQHPVVASSYTPESLVTAPSGLSADQLNNMLAGTGLEGLGEAFHDMEEKYGVNALFAAAHAANESAWGESDIARSKNNLFGINAVDSNPNDATRFSSFAESIDAYGRLLATMYVKRGEPFYGGDTIIDIFKNYSIDPNEPRTVVRIMMGLLSKDNLTTAA